MHTKKISRSRAGTILLGAFLSLFGIFMVLPMIYAVCSAFKPLEEIFLFPPRIFVQNPTIENFIVLGDLVSNLWVPFERYVFNTVFVSVVTTGVYLILASMAAYPLAKHDFPGRKFIREMITLALMFTSAVTGLSQYVIMAFLGLVDSYGAMIFPSLAGTIGVFLCVQYLGTLPDSMLEAGKIDGAGEMSIFWRLVIPNIRPAIFTVLIFQFQAVWSLAPNSVIYSEELKTMPMALSQIASAGVSRAGVGSAAALITMLLPMAVFILSQSNVMETMAHSGIKE